MTHLRPKHSLRTLISDHWGASRYCHPKFGVLDCMDLFAYHSHVLAYGVQDSNQSPENQKLVSYIQENAHSAMRLKAASVRAYESFANLNGRHYWSSVGSAPFLCLAAAISSLDAWACVVKAVVSGKVDTGSNIPDFPKVVNHFEMNHPANPLTPHLLALKKAPWQKALRVTRNKLVHRGLWPEWNDDEGLRLVSKRGILRSGLGEDGQGEAYRAIEAVDLPKFMVGFVKDLEEWERRVARLIADQARTPATPTLGMVVCIPITERSGETQEPLFETIYFQYDTAEEYIEVRNLIWRQSKKEDDPMTPGSYAF